MMRSTSLEKIARAGLYALPVLFFGVLLVVDVNPGGIRTLTYDLARPSAMISAFFPAGRLAGVAAGRQALLREPVYFTVRYPHSYRTATVTVKVDNPNNLAWRLGLRTVGGPDPAVPPADGDWSYALAEPDAGGSVTFSLGDARVTDRTIRFIIAVPEFTDGAAFYVKSVRVVFTRPPLVRSIIERL